MFLCSAGLQFPFRCTLTGTTGVPAARKYLPHTLQKSTWARLTDENARRKNTFLRNDSNTTTCFDKPSQPQPWQTPAPGKAPLWRASVPPSPSRGYCSPTNPRTGQSKRGRNGGWTSSMHPLGCSEELPGEPPAPLPYLPPCTGRSIAACRSCPRTPWGQSSGCSRERQGLCSGKEREGHISIERKESAYRTIQSGASHKKGCLPPPYLSDKASHPTALPFVQNSVRYLGDTRSRPPLL